MTNAMSSFMVAPVCLKAYCTAMRLCSVDGCAGHHHGKGLCKKHYQRPPGTEKIPYPVRGAPREWVLGVLSDVVGTGCRDWPFGLMNGRGYMRVDGTARYVTHLVLEVTEGPRPDKPFDQALHSCDRPICCAPWHLRWGSQSENLNEMVARGRGRWSK